MIFVTILGYQGKMEHKQDSDVSGFLSV